MRALVIVLCVAVTACAIKVSERKLIRPVASAALTQDLVDKFTPVFKLTPQEIVASDGARLRGVRLRQPNARLTVLYFGGNGYTAGKYGAWSAAVFAPLGVDLFIVDHRGYGQSEGKPTAALLASDALTIFDYVAALPDVGTDRLLVHGHSMGSFIAGYVASHRATAGVVLESSATTPEDWVEAATPGFVKPFVRTSIADELKGQGNLRNMPLIEEPLLIVVGEKDGTTPAKLSEKLYAASPLPEPRKSLLIVRGGKHNDSMMHKETIAAYRKLLTSAGGQKSPQP